MQDKLSPRGRCFRCGRFVKRGIMNIARHSVDECPEKQVILFSLDPTKCRLVKLKDMKP